MAELAVLSLADDAVSFGRQVREACESSGFFYIADHGIAQDEIDLAFQLNRLLFSNIDVQAMAEKTATVNRAENSGYTALAQEKLDPNASDAPSGDLKESFYIKRKAEQPLPSSLKSHQAALDSFYEACRITSLRVLRGFALALELPQDYFDSSHHAELDRLRLIHYPPAPVDREHTTGKIRAGSHSDYGSCTLLFQQNVGGLQVDLNNGKGDKRWVDVPPKPGCIVCNVGDAMEFWTAGRFQSTQHRVAMPQDASQSASRYSIAYFCQPDEDCKLQPLDPSWRTHVDKSKFGGLISSGNTITGGDYLRARLAATY